MPWSVPIGRLFGVAVRIHATFPLLIIYVAVQTAHELGDAAAGLRAALFTIVLFGCVVLHEFGHVLAARQFGCATRDVTLLPIGGVASLERIPEKPAQELWMAAAGPLVNVVIALAMLPFAGLGEIFKAGDPAWDLVHNLPAFLLLSNTTMFLFNLLPAFPMDGGRMLRALLAMKLNYVLATRIAAGIGRGMAVVFCAGSVLLPAHPPLLAVAGLFIWMGAGREARSVTARAALEPVRVRSAMITDFHAVSPFDALGDVVLRALAGLQKDFPVVNQGELLGMMTHSTLVRALQQKGSEALVAEVMEREFPTASPDESVHDVLLRTGNRTQSAPIVAVLDQGRLVGLLTLENVGEFLVLRDAAAQRAPPVM